MTTTAHPELVTLPICPPWCAGVGYQDWYENGDGRQQRDHSSAEAFVAGSIAVDVNTAESALGARWLIPRSVSTSPTTGRT